MKAIVANLFFGSIYCCSIVNYPTWANSENKTKNQPETPYFLSAKLLGEKIPLLPLELDFAIDNLDYSISASEKSYLKSLVNLNPLLIDNNSLAIYSHPQNYHDLAALKVPITHQSEQADLVLGFHPTFWPSQNPKNPKYWGLTTVELLGANPTNHNGSVKLNHNQANSAPILPQGTSALTLSGGGSKNLLQETNFLGEFKDFRGGVAFHRGVSPDVTLGVGFVYDQNLLGFSQFSYQPDDFPLQTTVSVLTQEEGLELHSRLSFRPVDNFVLNLYTEDLEHKFDTKWEMFSGVTLVAKGNTKDDSLNAGVNLAFGNDNFSFSASAKLNFENDNDWKWQMASSWGPLHLAMDRDRQKTNSELSYDLLESDKFGFQYSLFFEYKTHKRKKDEDDLSVWGWRFHSDEKLGRRYRWKLDIGYGIGSQGNGIVAATTAALTPDLSLQISYQDISLSSDEATWKLKLISK